MLVFCFFDRLLKLDVRNICGNVHVIGGIETIFGMTIQYSKWLSKSRNKLSEDGLSKEFQNY